MRILNQKIPRFFFIGIVLFIVFRFFLYFSRLQPQEETGQIGFEIALLLTTINFSMFYISNSSNLTKRIVSVIMLLACFAAITIGLYDPEWIVASYLLTIFTNFYYFDL